MNETRYTSDISKAMKPLLILRAVSPRSDFNLVTLRISLDDQKYLIENFKHCSVT